MHSLLFIFPLLLAGVVFAAPQESTWNEAVQSFQRGDFESSIGQFGRWSEAHQGKSPEALFNLSLAEWEKKQFGSSLFHLLSSTRLRNSPFQIASDLRTASLIQQKLGIKEGLTEHLPFQLSFLVNANIAAMLGSSSLWLFTFLALFWVRWKNRPRLRYARMPLLGMAIVCGALSLAGALAQHFFSPYAVAIFPESGIPLLKMPVEKGAEKLADLPSGTVIAVREVQGKFTEVTAPFAGWVESKSLRNLFPTLRQ